MLKQVLEIIIRIPYEDCIHNHSAEIPFKDNEELPENNPKLEGELKSALELLGKTKREVLIENKEIIKLLLEDEIAIKYYFVRGGACSSLRGNKELDQALRMWAENDILN